MRRLHLVELEDQPWLPAVIRDGGTDYLAFLLQRLNYYQPAISILEDVLARTDANRVVDLCSGSGGPIGTIASKIGSELSITFLLTDKYPNFTSWRALRDHNKDTLDFHPEPIDVLGTDEIPKGLRTMFSAVHHFRADEIRHILQRAVADKAAIAVFDSGDKNFRTILGILIFHPVIFVLCTPFFRPFKFSRLLFTYLIPFIPIYTIWDGVVSILRLYRSETLLRLAREADDTGQFDWNSGNVKHRLGFSIAYLIGVPKPS